MTRDALQKKRIRSALDALGDAHVDIDDARVLLGDFRGTGILDGSETDGLLEECAARIERVRAMCRGELRRIDR